MSLRRLQVMAADASMMEAFLAIFPVVNDRVSLELRRRADQLHPNHRNPYILSRLAASAALSSALRFPIDFVGSRDDARHYGLMLSLAHEDLVGAAVTWPIDAPFSLSIDVVDVGEVDRVTKRFPQFGARWMPNCKPTAMSSADILNIQETYGKLVDPVALILAQHWGLRECCVKLVGITGRSFPFECFRGPVALFPPHFEAHVVDRGREELRSVGLVPNLRVFVWPQVVQVPGGEEKLYVVVVAACRREILC
ncbi:uncharacterized protein TM35_000172940 [Trypanosoma theileri]|uniref:Uncharacterized protein n=1 Tax=Trypanosoma theileri TaxID=67003 RepID=A0A1X0NUR7_9TRYP|nr:uncharacterized protein TM35_000172940 [Trypanosoma theileri]ORC88422.1 hypothetical protein TM35_000172940 [Trypanosoma theileri]